MANEKKMTSENDSWKNNTSSKDYLLSCLLVGDVDSGKTSLFLRFICSYNLVPDTRSLSWEFGSRTVEIMKRKVKVNVRDFQDRNCHNQHYLSAMLQLLPCKGTKVLVVVFDLTNQRSFNNVRKWLKELKGYTGSDCTIMLVGNKCDLIDKRVVTEEEAGALAAQLGIPYAEVSAKSNINVDSTFMQLVEHALKVAIKKKKEMEEQPASLYSKTKSIHNHRNSTCCIM